MATKKAESPTAIETLNRHHVTFRIIGTKPFYFNAMSAKAKRDLLAGGSRKTSADKKMLKHNPEQEFRDSVYTMRDGETLLCFPSPGVKGAMSTAALETPGTTKSSAYRLLFLPEDKIRIWGMPYLKMDVVRSAGMNRTPDIRSRAFLPRWCAEVDVAYVTPALSTKSVAALLTNAGMIVGLGDFRQEKGRGNFGTFAVATANEMGEWEEDWKSITKEGRAIQEAAMASPEPYDEETAELLSFIQNERAERGLELVA